MTKIKIKLLDSEVITTEIEETEEELKNKLCNKLLDYIYLNDYVIRLGEIKYIKILDNVNLND